MLLSPPDGKPKTAPRDLRSFQQPLVYTVGRHTSKHDIIERRIPIFAALSRTHQTRPRYPVSLYLSRQMLDHAFLYKKHNDPRIRRTHVSTEETRLSIAKGRGYSRSARPQGPHRPPRPRRGRTPGAPGRPCSRGGCRPESCGRDKSPVKALRSKHSGGEALVSAVGALL
jgi:hypothetical protein